MLVSIITIVLLIISLGVLSIWIYFSIFIIRSLRSAPLLGELSKNNISIDIILPARNEEKFIGRCLESLLNQDYKNIRILAIDDSSTDNTPNIIKEYVKQDKRVVYINAGEKPQGWTGKNWACYQGYLNSNADILLFTDADSTFKSNLISLAISKFISNRLDALTLMPRILCLDPFTKVTLPLLNNLLYSRYSPLRVNDPKSKLGYFFGSFFIIKKSVYESIGTHKGVRDELIEDGALGSKVKALGYKLMMVRAEDYFDAIWARDLNTLWNALGRLIIPLYNKRLTVSSILLATFFIFLYPFISLIYSINNEYLLFVNIITIMLMLFMSMINAKNLKINMLYALGIPLGGFIIFLAFLSGIINAKRKGIKWRDREYAYKAYNANGFQL
jgi:cellulose synthase/poly-beta-1,6-N-acetylglucosamine synthase-like glycosyltransferase